jgi:hypothetical protein
VAQRLDFGVVQRLDLGGAALRFWVAQRFQRCDKAVFSVRALAPEVLHSSFGKL